MTNLPVHRLNLFKKEHNKNTHFFNRKRLENKCPRYHFEDILFSMEIAVILILGSNNTLQYSFVLLPKCDTCALHSKVLRVFQDRNCLPDKVISKRVISP